jgi:C4-dicarboxylate-specific signal transduction histidine kinase
MNPSARVALATILMPLAWVASIGLRRARRGRPAMDIEEFIPRAVLPENVALWRWDARTQELLATEHFASILGLTPATPLTIERAFERVHPEDRPQFHRIFGDAVPDDAPLEIHSWTIRVNSETSGLKWVESKTRITRNARGQVLSASGIVLDITDHKSSEDESERRQEQLFHLSRVAKLGQLSAALAHELNQPLASILSNAQAAQHYLSQEPVDLEEVRAIVDDIVSSDKRAGELIRRLREMVRRGETHAQTLDLKQIAREALELSATTLASASVEARVSIPSNLPAIRGDRVQLEQVFLNLLLNACEAMSEREMGERLIDITAATEGEMVHVRVTDRGVGIPERDLESVFDAFYTTKPTGLGLGLAISRSIISAHGGQLWATANECRGSCLHFTLPARATRH